MDSDPQHIAWDQYIQDAVNYLVEQTLASRPPGVVGTLYLPPGLYVINKPIIISRKFQDGYSYCSIRITGDCPSYGSANQHGSALITTSTKLPAIIVQAARAVRIENLAIMGKNEWVPTTAFGIDILYDDDNFLADGITDSSHAPYAGICIDPFAKKPKNPAPGDLYPGLEADYLASPGSSDITIESCFIHGFVVGIAISPNGFSDKNGEFTQQGDNISINRCTISATKSAIAVCQDQSRGISCRDLRVNGTKYVIDCTHYGEKAGCCPSIFTANIGLTKYIFSTYSFGAGAAFDGVFCEATLSLGVLGGGGTADGYAFNGCAFNLTYAADHPSIGYHLVNLARATFNACQFGLGASGRDEAAPLWIYSGGGPMSFRDCLMGVTNYPDNSPSFWLLGEPKRTSFSNTSVVYAPLGAMFSDILAIDIYLNVINQAVLPGCLLHQLAEPNNEDSPRWVASGLRSIQLGTVADTHLTLHPSNGTATFQPTTPGIVAPGDLVAVNQSYPGVIESYPAPITPVLGKVTAIDPQSGLVTLSHVPGYVFPQPPPATAPLSVVGFYKIHQSVTVHVKSDTFNDRVIDFPPHVRADTWVVGDRIRDKEGVIPAHTYVAAVEIDSPPGQVPTLLKLTLSRPMTGPPSSGTLTLYDADVRKFITTQVY